MLRIDCPRRWRARASRTFAGESFLPQAAATIGHLDLSCSFCPRVAQYKCLGFTQLSLLHLCAA